MITRSIRLIDFIKFLKYLKDLNLIREYYSKLIKNRLIFIILII